MLLRYLKHVYGLSITSKINLRIVDYLDVTFDLQDNSYQSYRKPDNLPVYTQTLEPSTNNSKQVT